MSLNCELNSDTIQFCNVSFSYGQEKVLSDINFSIPKGDYVAVVGPNGAGKSTLLKILLGLLNPQEGTVTIFGHGREDAKEHFDIGYVPQKVVSSEFMIPATVEEVICSARVGSRGLLSSLSKNDIIFCQKAMEKLGLMDIKEKRVNLLSGGQRQRVFIARALARNPKILILDEPTVGVDIGVKQKFFELLDELCNSGLTIVIVSHDVDLMKERAKTILGIHRRVVCQMPAKNFDAHQYAHDLYLGEAEHLH